MHNCVGLLIQRIVDPRGKVRQVAEGLSTGQTPSPAGILSAVSVRERHFVDFTGTWDVLSSPDFDDEYLRLGGVSYVTLHQNGGFVKGEYRIGVQYGTINGGAHSDFVDFYFQGNDEMEEALGEGKATLDGERLIFELWHYHRDQYTFECKRRR